MSTNPVTPQHPTPHKSPLMQVDNVEPMPSPGMIRLEFSPEAREALNRCFKSGDHDIVRRGLLDKIDQADVLVADDTEGILLRVELLGCFFYMLDQRADLGLVLVQSIEGAGPEGPKDPKNSSILIAIRNAAVGEVVKIVLGEVIKHGKDFLPPWNEQRELLVQISLGGPEVWPSQGRSGLRNGLFPLQQLGADRFYERDRSAERLTLLDASDTSLQIPGSQILVGLSLEISIDARLFSNVFIFNEIDGDVEFSGCSHLPMMDRPNSEYRDREWLSKNVGLDAFSTGISPRNWDAGSNWSNVDGIASATLKVQTDFPINVFGEHCSLARSHPNLSTGSLIDDAMPSMHLSSDDAVLECAGRRFGDDMAKQIKRHPADIPIHGDKLLEADANHSKRLDASNVKPNDLRDVDVRAIRMRMSMTQEQFAECFGLSVASLRNWEQGTRRPEQPIALYLRVIDKFPEQVMKEIAAMKNAS